MRLDHYKLSISPISHIRAAYHVTKSMVFIGSSLIALMVFSGSLFYLLGFFVQTLQSPEHNWLDKTVRDSANVVQISQYGQFPTWKPEKSITVNTRGISHKRLSGMLSLACSGQSLMAGVPIIGSPVGFVLGIWNGYLAP